MKNTFAIYFGNLKAESIVIILEIQKNKRVLNFQSFTLKNISENLWQEIQEFLNKRQINLEAIEKIYLNNGPTRFNGDRLITLGAKTFAHFRSIPLFKISNLELCMLWHKKKSIFIKVDASNYFFACKDSEKNLVESLVNEAEFNKINEKSLVKPKVVKYLNLSDHENAVVKYLDKFKKVDNILSLEPNYIKNPV